MANHTKLQVTINLSQNEYENSNRCIIFFKFYRTHWSLLWFRRLLIAISFLCKFIKI